MKTNVILIVIMSLGVLFTSCEKNDINVSPSGDVTTSNISVLKFNNLNVQDIFKVYVNFSETEESVQIEANSNIHQLVEIDQTGESLNIKLKRNTRISGIPVLNVYIKTKSLEKVKAEGAALVVFQNSLNGNILELELTGASNFIGSISVDELYSDIYGASNMDVTGSSNSIEINAEGACSMTGFEFETNQLKANINGASNVSLTVNQSLNVTASGGSKVYYKGDGVIVNQKVKDSSGIIKLN